jgi:hypothetical protein
LQKENVMHVALVRHIVAGRPRSRGQQGTGRIASFAAGLAAIALALVSLNSSAALADRWTPVDRSSSVAQGPVAVSVTVDGRGTPLYQRADRTDRWYLEAREGASYKVSVRNLTGERVAFVLSVDGLNAINGLQSHLGSDEPMYVLEPYGQTTVKGWRKSLDNVSKFLFVDEERSYAARTDQANGDLGWIRVVAFNEIRPMAWGHIMNQYRGNDAPAPVAPAPSLRGDANRMQAKGQGETARDIAPLADQRADESSPGTGWGANQRDRVHEVDFRAQPYAAAQVILRYEYHDALERLGVLPWHGRGRDRLEERENGQLGFAQPPKW